MKVGGPHLCSEQWNVASWRGFLGTNMRGLGDCQLLQFCICSGARLGPTAAKWGAGSASGSDRVVVPCCPFIRDKMKAGAYTWWLPLPPVV